MVLFPVTLSELEWLSEILNDTRHRAASLRQLSFCLICCTDLHWLDDPPRLQYSKPYKSDSDRRLTKQASLAPAVLRHTCLRARSSSTSVVRSAVWIFLFLDRRSRARFPTTSEIWRAAHWEFSFVVQNVLIHWTLSVFCTLESLWRWSVGHSPLDTPPLTHCHPGISGLPPGQCHPVNFAPDLGHFPWLLKRKFEN